MAQGQQTKAVQRMPKELQGLRPAGSYTFDELYRIAAACAASGLFEDTKDEAQALMKILRGQEMGLPPTTAMTAFDIIAKRIFIKPWAIAAKINSCGYGGYVVLTSTDQECTIQFRRKYPGQGWRDLSPITYTFAEAQAQGLTGRSAHWRNSPAHMLYMRAMGRGGARYFPELLAGLEPPPDDTPIPTQHAQRNIEELWGSRAAREDTVDLETGEVIDAAAVQEETPRQRLEGFLQQARPLAKQTTRLVESGDEPLPHMLKMVTAVIEGERILQDPSVSDDDVDDCASAIADLLQAGQVGVGGGQ